MKFDGYRAEIAISGSEVVVYTRNGHDWTQQFKVIVPGLKTLTKGSVLLDGEIVAIDKAGRTNFSMLKTGIGAGIPLKFYAFDIFERDGQDLTGLPLLERKAILEELIGARDPVDSLQYSHHVADNGKQVFDAMCAGGHEGVIAKRADRPYIGERTTTWLKIKCTKRQEFVIGGWRPSDNGRGMASLILGTYEGGKFIYRGRVGTGFSDVMRDKILKQMEARRIEKSAFAAVPRDIARKARWVRPELVAEVAYAEITPDGSVRHASFQGMRADKKAKRKGRIFLDYLRNGQGSTAICPWSTRARAGGTCAVPVTWEELDELDRANSFDIFAAAARAQKPDAWEGYFETQQTLTEQMQAVVKR